MYDEITTQKYVETCLEKYFASGRVIDFRISVLPDDPPEPLFGHSQGKAYVKLVLEMVKEEY